MRKHRTGKRAEIAGGGTKKSIRNCMKAECVIIIEMCRSEYMYRI